MGDITRLLSFKKLTVDYRGNLNLLMKKIQFLIMSKPTERVTDSSALIYIFKPETKQHTPSFLVQIQLYESLKCDECSVRCIPKKKKKANPPQTQTNTTPWECLHLAWWCPALVSFHPGSYQITVVCTERAACGSTGWFFKGLQDWQVYSPLNAEGLSLSAAPEPPAGSALRQANFLKPE